MTFLNSLLLRAVSLRNGCKAEFYSDHIDVIRRGQVIRLAKRHSPYLVDMVHSFDYYFTPVFPEIEGTREVVDYSRTRLHRYRDTGLEFELTSLPEEAAALEGYFRWYSPLAGDTVFDAGAYCGVSAYRFSRMVGDTGHVFAFEPDPDNHACLIRNIQRHGLTNVTPVRAGLAGTSGTGAFHREGALGSGLAQLANRATAGTVEQIDTMSFADACDRFGVPAFAKVDIEGAEIEMLEGARPFLVSHPIQFALDTNHKVNGALTFTAVERILNHCGYETESSDSLGFMTTWARPCSAGQISI